MKLRHPRLISLVAFIAAKFIRIWIWTVRYHYLHFGPDIRPTTAKPHERYIYAFWHENMLLLSYHYGRPDVWILISHHADGQLIAEITGKLGFRAVRGSTTRGGAEAVRQMLQIGTRDHLAITPDGPRGPRRKVQPGLLYTAARTGMPIVAAGISYKRAWRASSWDRLAFPYPFTRGVCIVTAPIYVPQDLDKSGIESYRQFMQETLDILSAMADEWAQTGMQPPIPILPTLPTLRAQAG